MHNISAVIIGKLIEAHMQHDELKFLEYANLVADILDECKEEESADIIRGKLYNAQNSSDTISFDDVKKNFDFIGIYSTTFQCGKHAATKLYIHNQEKLCDSEMIWEIAPYRARFSNDGGNTYYTIEF